jgi:hypothetical protein
MSIGANVAVITTGAVIAFAVRVHSSGFSVQVVGGVLMAVGALSLAMQISALAKQRELTTVQAEVLPEAVLVRPYGSTQPPYGPQGTTAMPLAPGESPYQSTDEYTGNEW